jgi:hypothetical protein
LRPIAQAGSHRPAMSRKSQAMGDPPKMFVQLSASPRSLPFVQRVRVRKTVQRRIMNLKRRKQPISHEGGRASAINFATGSAALRLSAYRGRSEVAFARSRRAVSSRTWSQRNETVKQAHRGTWLGRSWQVAFSSSTIF